MSPLRSDQPSPAVVAHGPNVRTTHLGHGFYPKRSSVPMSHVPCLHFLKLLRTPVCTTPTRACYPRFNIQNNASDLAPRRTPTRTREFSIAVKGYAHATCRKGCVSSVSITAPSAPLTERCVTTTRSVICRGDSSGAVCAGFPFRPNLANNACHGATRRTMRGAHSWSHTVNIFSNSNFPLELDMVLPGEHFKNKSHPHPDQYSTTQ